MIPGSDDGYPSLGGPRRAVRLVGDAGAVAWVVGVLRSRGVDAAPQPDGGAGEGPVVWVTRPEESPDGTVSLSQPAAFSIPSLVVIPPGGRPPETLAGAPAVETFEIVREPEDAPVLSLRLERLLLLHRRKTQTEIVLHNLSDVVYTRTFDGILTSINAAGERLLGRRREELIGRPLASFVLGMHLASDIQTRTNAELSATGRSRARITFPDDRGRSRVFDREALLLRDGHGKPVGVQVILTDVTEELAARERLERDAERNDVLAGIASAARDSLDLARVLGAAAALLGPRVGAHSVRVWLFDETKTSCSVAHHWRADEEVPALAGLATSVDDNEELRDLCRTLRPIVVRDVTGAEAQGFTREVMARLGARSLAAFPIHREGEIIGLLGLAFREPHPFPLDELTFFDRVADQLALAIRAARLYARLERQVAELAEAQRAREEAHRDRERLSAMVVHDLKSPLSAVTAALELTCEKARAQRDDRLVRMLAGSVASARSLQGLIEDALLVYRPGDAPEPERRTVGVAEALSVPLEEARWLAKTRNLTLRVEITDTLPQVRVDLPRFRRAAANLLGNALKFTPQGGEVTASAELIPGPDGEPLFVFRVSDTGPGVPEALRDRLGVPWVRLSGTDKVSGAGLGLTIAQMVARSHGGRLEVAGREGGGSVFSIVLPASGVTPAPVRC